MVGILKVTSQAAIDTAIPLAVQAAVAQKEGELASALYLADSWKLQAEKAEKKKWDYLGIGYGAGIVTSIAVGVVLYYLRP